jgi:hypothetical protein
VFKGEVQSIQASQLNPEDSWNGRGRTRYKLGVSEFAVLGIKIDAPDQEARRAKHDAEILARTLHLTVTSAFPATVHDSNSASGGKVLGLGQGVIKAWQRLANNVTKCAEGSTLHSKQTHPMCQEWPKLRRMCTTIRAQRTRSSVARELGKKTIKGQQSVVEASVLATQLIPHSHVLAASGLR